MIKQTLKLKTEEPKNNPDTSVKPKAISVPQKEEVKNAPKVTKPKKPENKNKKVKNNEDDEFAGFDFAIHSDSENEYKKVRNMIKKTLKKEEPNYYKEMFSEEALSNSDAWRTVYSALGSS